MEIIRVLVVSVLLRVLSSCKEEDFNAYFKASDSRIEGRDYSVVSILGCQSSGKSKRSFSSLSHSYFCWTGTLLNLLFGTCFEMMDRLKGRNQTTRGIWMGCATKIPGIVVMVIPARFSFFCPLMKDAGS